MNRCPRDGYLVGARYPIPDDPTELSVPNLSPVGCNRLRCQRCGIPVLNTLASPANPNARLYFCECSQWTETGVQPLEDDDPESFRSSPNVPWRCDGHPLLSLPPAIDGLSAESLLRLHARLQPADAATLTATVLARLDNPDTRPAAIGFFRHVDHPPARTRLVELLTAAGPQSPVDGGVWRVLAPGIESEEPVRSLARAFALAGNSTGELFRALAAGDPDWFHSNATAMARANIGIAEELYDSFLHLPDDYVNASPSRTKWFHRTREVIRYLIADSITLDEALLRAAPPLATWDGNEVYSTRLRIFKVSQFGAVYQKSQEVEPATFETWNNRTLALGGRVGASHTHSEVVWHFEDDDCGVWNKSRRILRGDRTRLLIAGSFVPTESIASVSSFLDATPEKVHRGVHCTLTDGRQLLLHEEHDDDPPDSLENPGEPVEWESAWVWQLADDLATFVGVPYLNSSGGASNSRRLAIRAHLLAFASEITAAPSVPATRAIGRHNETDTDLALRWEPAPGRLVFVRSSGDRSWERVERHGSATDAAIWLRHFITSRRLLAGIFGGYI